MTINRILASEVIYDANHGLYFRDGKLFSGVAFFVRDDGFQDAEITYIEGLRSGITREWHEPGVLALEESYLEGVLHGEARSWFADGKPAHQGRYEYGVALWEKRWDEGGKVLNEYCLCEDGPQYRLLQDFREIEGGCR